MSIDLDTDMATMFDTAEFGVVASWTFHRTGAVSSVSGIFDKLTTEIDAESSSIVSDKPQFTCRESDIADWLEGDDVVISGENYRVITVRLDGTGGAVVTLHDG